MKKPGLLFGIILIAFAVIFNCCEKEEDNLPPVCNIEMPSDSTEFSLGDTININVEAVDLKGSIKIILFYIDDVAKFSTSSVPYQFKWITINEAVGYHIIRASAFDREGNSSSDECIIKLVINPPVVITADVSSVTNNSAVCGGNVISDGGAAVTARGVCCSTAPNPTLDNVKGYTTDSAGTGSYISYLTGLSRATTYYIRAYATNSEGTSYGEQVEFITEPTSLAIKTSAITNITDESAVCGGEITDDGGLDVTARGVCWNTTGEPTLSHNYTTSGTGPGSFTCKITGLSSNTIYFARAFATNSRDKTTFGNTISFKTSATLPDVITSEVSLITCNSAQVVANVIDDGGKTVTQRGICWSTTPDPTINDSKTKNGSRIGSFTVDISGLTHTTKYYTRAYAINSLGVAYGETIEFQTNRPEIPAVKTLPVYNISSTTASGGGEITTDGCIPVTACGICWSTSPNPIISDNITIYNFGISSFKSNLINLEPNTTYYVRAYATNSEGTSYGNQVGFTTNSALPTVITTSISSVTSSSAKSGGNVKSDGGVNVTAKGVCWSTSPNPTIYDYTTNDGTDTGSFASSITGLNRGTTYYVRAYAINSVGTVYGNQVSFTTNSALPAVITATANSFTTSSAQSGGNVIDDGGNSVTAKGVCWSTSPNPTIYDYTTNDGSGTGLFVSSITGLDRGTTYYLRAYAVNSQGTAYGNEIEFTTLTYMPCPGTPTVSDYDGNKYTAVQIGDQCWMKENLKTTHYADGTPLVDGKGVRLTIDELIKYWFVYNDDLSYKNKYGLLYTWTAIMNDAPSSNVNPSGIQGVCPTGWHIPSHAEWQELVDYLGGPDIAGGKLKEAGITHWNFPNIGATNESNFTALPNGWRCDEGFGGIGSIAYLWSSTKSYSDNAYSMELIYNLENAFDSFGYPIEIGLAVRCIKD